MKKIRDSPVEKFLKCLQKWNNSVMWSSQERGDGIRSLSVCFFIPFFLLFSFPFLQSLFILSYHLAIFYYQIFSSVKVQWILCSLISNTSISSSIIYNTWIFNLKNLWIFKIKNKNDVDNSWLYDVNFRRK